MLKRLHGERSHAAGIAGFGRYVFRQAGSRAFWALLFLVLGSLTEGISILLLIPVIQLMGLQGADHIVRLPTSVLSGVLGPQVQLSLATVLGVLVVLVLAQALFSRFRTIYMSRLMHQLINRLRTELFASIGRAKWQFITSLRMADLDHLLTSDIDRVQTAAFHLLLLMQSGALLVVYIAVSWLISPAMTLFASVIGVGVLAALHPLRNMASAHGDALTENRQAQHRTVSEFLSALKIAKSFNAEPRYAAKLAATLDRARRDLDRFVRLNSIGGVALQVSSALGLALFVYVAIARLALPLPHIIVLVFLFMRVSPRVMALQGHLQEILINVPAFAAIQSVQAACNREQEPPASSQPPPSLQHEVRLERVSVRYAEGAARNAVDDVSFSLPARQITALVGPSGSGKSTLADVLMGLLEPSGGAVAIDGTALTEANRSAWRTHVAYVPQDVVLIHDSIAANFRLAVPDAAEEAMWEALKTANAHEFVERLPDRLQTVVGERGARLSGGERQRLALARALLRRPQLLILDEATSALDWENQRLIARAIRELRGSMTILTIAHRPSMIAFADRVVVLEDGKVVESGGYDALIREGGSRLARMVAGDQSIREADKPDIPAAVRE
jgi:ATP-binding cassette subfamily C protein